MCPKTTFTFLEKKKKVNLFLFQKKQIEGKAFVHCPLHQNEYPPKECEVLFSAHMCLVCSWLHVLTKVMEENILN